MEYGIREIQQIELDMIKIVKTICEKHNLRYYLSFGTLIGAVRHHGFIPWDDDADLIMPPEDYRAFRKYFKREVTEEYFLENMQSECFCPFSWTKVRKDGTTSLPVNLKALPIHWGICIDVFRSTRKMSKKSYLIKISPFR